MHIQYTYLLDIPAIYTLWPPSGVNMKWLPLQTVLHVLWIHLSMMLLTSCFSIPWLLICLLAPSDLQSTKNFMMNFWKTWNFSILHSLLWKGSFSDAIDEQFQPTLIQIFVIPLITFTAVKLTYLEKTSVYSFTWFIERSFNDAVDELFQHTLTTHAYA